MTKFIPQQKNANKHTLHGTRLLEKSVTSDGWIDAQTSAADGEMISGTARLELAEDKFAGVEPIVIDSDGTRPVIIRRTDIPDLNDPRAKRLSIAANQIAHTDLDFDGDLLKEWGNEDAAIKAMFAESEWTEITGEEKPTVDAEPQIDRAAELLEKWQVKTGDLWQIGTHRLICGDCTDAAVVARVMGGERATLVFTDPPYGVGKEIENDDLTGLDFDDFNAKWVRVMETENDCGFVCYHSTRTFPSVLTSAVDAGWKFERMLWYYVPDKFPAHSWKHWMMVSQAIMLFTLTQKATKIVTR